MSTKLINPPEPTPPATPAPAPKATDAWMGEAIALRVKGMEWGKIADTLAQLGFVRANGQPWSPGAVCSAVLEAQPGLRQKTVSKRTKVQIEADKANANAAEIFSLLKAIKQSSMPLRVKAQIEDLLWSVTL